MKRLIHTIQQHTGLTKSEALVCSSIVGILLFGWIVRSVLDNATNTHEQSAQRVIALLDSLMSVVSPVNTNKEIPQYSQPSSHSQAYRNSVSEKQSGTLQRSRININTASAQRLEELPGIGPAMAQRIVAERSVRKFSSVEDLERVKGIGPKKLEKIRPYVTAP